MNCIVCGKEITDPKQKVYCSRDCCLRQARKTWRQKHKTERTKPESNREAPKKVTAQSWNEVLDGMKKTGLSYGYYVARSEG